MKKPFYIFSNGRLKRKQNTLFFYKYTDDRTPDGASEEEGEHSGRPAGGKNVIPIEQVEALYLFGEVDINSKLISFLARNKVPSFFYDYYGNYTATLWPRPAQLSGKLHIKQAQHYLSKKKRTKLARAIVDASAHNMLKVVKYYSNRIDSAGDLTETIDYIDKLRASLPQQDDIPQIMGIEGNIRQAYYSTWDIILMDTDFEFNQRNYHPPSNEVNALISFGNAMCYSSVLRQIYRTALDPTISFLHEPGDRRFSLALDLAEVFKPLLVDRLLFKLLRKRSLNAKHFEPRLNGIFLKDSGRKIFVKNWDDRLKQTIHHRKLDRKVSYQRLIRLDCYSLIRHVLSDSADEEWKGFRMWW